MNLFDNKEDMYNIINYASESLLYPASVIEKDYETISSELIEPNEYKKYKYDKVIKLLSKLNMF